jgi:hypothetical protein
MHIIYFFSYVNFNISKAKNEIERMMAVGLTTGINNLKKSSIIIIQTSLRSYL